MSRSSLAVTTIDRTARYFGADVVRKQPDFQARYVNGVALQTKLRELWLRREAEQRLACLTKRAR